MSLVTQFAAGAAEMLEAVVVVIDLSVRITWEKWTFCQLWPTANPSAQPYALLDRLDCTRSARAMLARFCALGKAVNIHNTLYFDLIPSEHPLVRVFCRIVGNFW